MGGVDVRRDSPYWTHYCDWRVSYVFKCGEREFVPSGAVASGKLHREYLINEIHNRDDDKKQTSLFDIRPHLLSVLTIIRLLLVGSISLLLRCSSIVE